MGPIAGRLSDRIGPRPLMTAGLLIVAASLFWQSGITVDTTLRVPAAGAFVLMGLGMGLVMSPMSTAAMNAVDQTKAGVASGMLSMSRMVGGTFGVAVHGRADRDARPLASIDAAPARMFRPARAATLANSLGGGGIQHGLGAGRRRRARGVRVGARHRPGDQRRGHVLRRDRRVGADRADGCQAQHGGRRGATPAAADQEAAPELTAV